MLVYHLCCDDKLPGQIAHGVSKNCKCYMPLTYQLIYSHVRNKDRRYLKNIMTSIYLFFAYFCHDSKLALVHFFLRFQRQDHKKSAGC
jgi:hypothetical protein